MKIVVNLENTDNYQEIDIGEDKYVYDLLIILQTVFDIPFSNITLKLNGTIISDPYTPISYLKINNDDILIVSSKSQTSSSKSTCFSLLLKSSADSNAVFILFPPIFYCYRYF